MPNDVSVAAVAPAPPRSPEAPVTARASAPPVPTVQVAAAPPAAAPSATTSAGTPNPTLRLDPALGLVVIEFVSKSGAVTTSIPSQRELAAYQNGTAQPPGKPQTSV